MKAPTRRSVGRSRRTWTPPSTRPTSAGRASPLLAWGISLGAAALVYSEQATGLDGVILESMYADIDTAFDNRVALRLPESLAFLAEGVRLATATRLGLDPEALRPVDRLGRFPGEKVFLARGAGDAHMVAEELDRLAATVPGATVVTVPDVRHVDLLSRGGEGFRESVEAFLRSRAGEAR